MFCRYCGHEQEDGAFCDKCGKPLGGAVQVTVDEQPPMADIRSVNDANVQPEIKKSKAPIIAVAVVCAVAVGAGLLFVLVSGRDKVKTDDSKDTKPAVTTVRNDDQAGEDKGNNEDSHKDAVLIVDEDQSSEENVTTTAVTTTTVTTAAPEPEKVEVIPATELFDMSTAEIKALVGDDYRVYADTEFAEFLGYTPYGITSDTYFPNTVLFIDDADGEDDTRTKFENGGTVYEIKVYDGGLIGSGVNVGDTYNSVITKIDSLCGVQSRSPITDSIVDGHIVRLSFDINGSVSDVVGESEAPVIDLYDTELGDSKIEWAELTSSSSPSTDDETWCEKGTIIGDDVALRAAPYSEAASLWTLKKGDVVYITPVILFDYTDSKGEEWYAIEEYRTKDGVWKNGYAHAEYIRVD